MKKGLEDRENALRELRLGVNQLWRDFPDRSGMLSDFTTYFQQIVRPSADAADLVEQLCDWFAASQELEESWEESGGDKKAFKDAVDAAKKLLKKARRDIDKAYAALANVSAEFPEETRPLNTALNGLIAILESQSGVVDPRSALGMCLMQLMREVGYGRVGKHRYSTAEAARLVNSVARTYDMELNEASLCAGAPYLPEIPKEARANLDDVLKNFARAYLRPHEQSRVSDDEAER